MKTIAQAKKEALQIKWYGWKPDLPDPRDHPYKVVNPNREIQSVHLKDKYNMPPVFDQGNLGSCGPNAGSWIYQFMVMNGLITHKTLITMPFSRLFLYYNTRLLEGTINYDSGVYIRDVIKAAVNFGVCSDKAWPYIIAKYTKKPPQTAYKSALNYQALEYQRVGNTSKLACVDALSQGFPIQVGFVVFDSFESYEVAKTGTVPMPNLTSESMLGGHSTVIVGYNAITDRYELVNSWGANWGQQGYFTMPAGYLNNNNLADDFWIIKKIE